MRRTPLIAATILSIAALSSCAAPAYAASDSPTPYSVTVEGVTLPAGVVFADGGHVNWTTTTGSHSIHFGSLNGQPSGQYIGKSFLPFDLAEGECVTWVQVAGFDEHFGEGGQEPICRGETPSVPTPSPSPSPTPTDSPTSTPTSQPPANTDSQSPTRINSEPTSRTGVTARLAETGSDPWLLPITMAIGVTLGFTGATIVKRSRK